MNVNSFFKSFFRKCLFNNFLCVISDFIRITNELLFVNNFFQSFLLLYQYQIDFLNLRLRYNIICWFWRQQLFSFSFRNDFCHLAHVIIYQLNAVRSITFSLIFVISQRRSFLQSNEFIVRF